MESFKTKKAITDLLNQFLKDNEAGVIKDENIIDVLYSLIANTQFEKLSDYKSFSIVLLDRKHKAYVIDTSEEQVSFSYRMLVREYEPLCKRQRLPVFIINLQRACRNEIADQIKEYVMNGNQCLAYYPIPFVQLVANWYELRGRREYKFRKDAKFNNLYFYEAECSEHWKAYHREHAKLRVIDIVEKSKNGSSGVRVNWYNLINKNT